MTIENSQVTRLMSSVVGFAVGYPRFTVVFVLALTAVSLVFVRNHLGINTDTAGMMDDSLQWRQDFDAYRDSFPARDGNLVLVVDGTDSETAFAYARELYDELSREPELFTEVFMPGAGEFFERNGLLFLPIDELEDLSDRLIDAQPLLGRLAEDVSGAGLMDVLTESVDQSNDVPAAVTDELDQVLLEVARTLEANRMDARRPISWGSLLGTDISGNARQIMLVRPAVDFNRVRPARAAIERIRELETRLGERYDDTASLRLTGTLAMEHEELTSITRSASAAGIAALVTVMLVLIWALRSFVMLAIAVVVLLAGLSLTAAFAALTVGELNLLSVAFAVLYVGLGVDFILHMSLRIRELTASGKSLELALTGTARGVGSSLLFCAVTTAAGFFAFMPTDFTGISELGLISGGGMLISLAVSLSLLPALIRLFFTERSTGNIYPVVARSPLNMPMPSPRPVIFGAVLVTAAGAVLLPALRFDANPIQLRDPDAESIQAIEDLANDSEAPLFSLTVTVADAAEARATVAALSTLESVMSVQTVAALVPEDQNDKLDLIDELALFLGATLSRFEPGTPDPARLFASLRRLAGALAQDDDLDATRSRILAATESVITYGTSLSEDDWRRFGESLESDLLGNLVDEVRRLETGLGARNFGRDDLPDELLSRWINSDGEELIEVVPRDNLNDPVAAARFVNDVRSVAPRATGLPVVYQEAGNTVKRAFSFAIGYAFAIVTLLLLLFLRSIRDTVLVLVPIVFAAVATAGAAVLLGLPLNFANIIALPLLIGVGVDSGIHIVHRMRTEPPADGDPLHTSTSRAVFMSALTTVASFGNLAFSSHVGMASMGQLLTLGMVMSLFAMLVLLPALLRQWGRA